jgi:hypothetical protein
MAAIDDLPDLPTNAITSKLLTLKQMQERLSEMTYRPGWVMEMYQGHSEGTHFKIYAKVEDSVRKGEVVDLEIHSVVPPQVSIESFDLWVADRLKRIEIHESMEWLQVDGKPVLCPHRPMADRDMY